MAGVNWGGIANSGFDAFGNFQGGWEVGSIPLHTSLQPLERVMHFSLVPAPAPPS